MALECNRIVTLDFIMDSKVIMETQTQVSQDRYKAMDRF